MTSWCPADDQSSFQWPTFVFSVGQYIIKIVWSIQFIFRRNSAFILQWPISKHSVRCWHLVVSCCIWKQRLQSDWSFCQSTRKYYNVHNSYFVKSSWNTDDLWSVFGYRLILCRTVLECSLSVVVCCVSTLLVDGLTVTETQAASLSLLMMMLTAAAEDPGPSTIWYDVLICFNAIVSYGLIESS